MRAAALLLTLATLGAAEAPLPTLRVLGQGFTPVYGSQGPRRQDLSGAVCVDGRAYLAYDGGESSAHPEIRVVSVDRLEAPGKVLPRVTAQRDLEAMTHVHGTFYVLSSLSQTDEDTEAYRLLCAFTLDPSGRFVRSERAVVLRDLLVDALRVFPDEAWFGRVAVTFGVKGGLNAEGLAQDPEEPEALRVGLRSPLYGPAFGDPAFGLGFRLDRGEALVARVLRPFSDRPTVTFERLDLGGHGIRELTWIPQLGAYLVIGGPVDRAPGFSLWCWTPGAAARRIPFPAFDRLCRPEAILPVPGRREVILLSEEGGAFCVDPPYTYLRLGF